jgi:hypothetical protein
MDKHWKYLEYVLKHKFYVFLWCCRYGLPLAGIVHDLSKFHPREWFPYVDYFYGGPWPKENSPGMKDYLRGPWSGTQRWVDERFNAAWNHHQKRNPHHWQYWVLLEDSGAVKCLRMPDRYRREMIADWRGASMAINGMDNTGEWYMKNRHKMRLHPDTQLWVERELGLIATANGVEFRIADLMDDLAGGE